MIKCLIFVAVLVPMTLHANGPYRGEYRAHLCGRPIPDLKICIGKPYESHRNYVAVMKLKDDAVLETYFFKLSDRSQTSEGILETVYETQPEMDCLLENPSRPVFESKYKIILQIKSSGPFQGSFYKEVMGSYKIVGESFQVFAPEKDELVQR